MRNLFISLDDPRRAPVVHLIEEHMAEMASYSPPETLHSLDVQALCEPEVAFWTARDGEILLGCGALKELDARHGEIKSMHTVRRARRRGVAAGILAHIIEQSRQRGYRYLSLETGSMDVFAPARALYETFGFVYCEPFADYQPHPISAFMTMTLD